jgi:hypothetical protein
MRGSTVNTGLVPEPLRNSDRVDIHRRPPCRLVASPMEGTMVGAAKRDGKLITDPTAQSARLHEPQVMRVRRAPSAHEAGLRGNDLEVRTVAVTAGLAQRERALVDMPGNRVVHPLFCLSSCGRRLNLNRRKCRRWRLSAGLGLPTCRGGFRARAYQRRFLRGAECNTGTEGSQQRDTSWRLSTSLA